MKRHSLSAGVLVVVFFGLLCAGCAKKVDDGKIPITTSSEEARKEFLQGRDLAERTLVTNSLQHFDKAIALDPNFATAHLYRANVSFTGTDFFDHLKKAVALSDKVSEAERLLILATEAGVNANVPKQKEYLEKLVALRPNDERAHLNYGGFFFGQQKYAEAIEQYQKSVAIDPGFSPVYNILGYAYRQIENYQEAEKAFKKYTELIPNDPNPFDSYAELLMKMGRFDESLTNYQKALSIDPNFVSSHVGIAANYMYKGMQNEGAAQLNKLYDMARHDGERRQALFTQMVLYIDQGKMDLALQGLERQYALGEKTNDVAAMSGDLGSKANILYEMGKYDEALAAYQQIVRMIDASDLSPEIKANTKLFHHYNLAMVAVGKKDMKTAEAEAAEFQKGVEASKDPNQIRQAFQLTGTIAFAQKKYEIAVAQLQQANMQDPSDLYRLGQAYQGKGDKAKAKEFFTKAAHFNGLPALNYAFVRTKAEKLAAAK